MTTRDDVQSVRSKLANRCLFLGTLLGILALTFSLVRTYQFSWQPLKLIHSGVFLVLVGTLICRRRLPYYFRVSVILGALLIIGVFGLLTYGLMGPEVILFAFCVLATAFFGTRAGIVALLLTLMLIGLISWGFLSDVISLKVDPAQYIRSPSSWLNAIAGMGLFAGVVVMSLGTVYQQLIDLLNTVEDSALRQSEMNQRLAGEITERKKAEASNLKAKKEADFYLDLMSHDLTNFNHTLLGNLTMMEKFGTAGEKEIDIIEACKRQVVKSESLIAKVRALAAVENVEWPSLFGIDLNKYIEDAMQAVRDLYPNKQIRFGYEPIEAKVLANDLFESVLVNLIENSIKHNPGVSAWIGISLSTELPEEENFLELRIEDDGPGVPERKKEEIFERYSRIGEVKGTGLGLSLCKAIVDRLGGRLWVEDRLEDGAIKGSVFKIRLARG